MSSIFLRRNSTSSSDGGSLSRLFFRIFNLATDEDNVHCSLNFKSFVSYLRLKIWHRIPMAMLRGCNSGSRKAKMVSNRKPWALAVNDGYWAWRCQMCSRDNYTKNLFLEKENSNFIAFWCKKKARTPACIDRISVGDPDPHAFGPPRSESISKRYGSKDLDLDPHWTVQAKSRYYKKSRWSSKRWPLKI